MFRTLRRKFLPNPLDRMLQRCAKKGGKRVLFCWNRGLGDIALGLYAMVERVRERVPGAEVTFLTRENLVDGFSLLEGVKVIGVAGWKRGEKKEGGVDLGSYDLVIENPDPSEWVRWQRGKVVPRLKWNPAHDELWKKFGLEEGSIYVGVQVSAETCYGLWRNWPVERWRELFERLELLKKYKVLLFGFAPEPLFSHECVIDLRGKTTLFELLSLIKNRCSYLILPDSGILSFSYYLDAQFPIELLSLWADPNHGILKQNVASPNRLLRHIPLIGKEGDLSTVSVNEVLERIVPTSPLRTCPLASEVIPAPLQQVGALILAGGQGTRLGVKGPKGLFRLRGKSLFEWLIEKAPRIPIAVMTSDLNHEETVAFFKDKKNFGREIYFFSQGESDGNGSLYQAFHKARLGELFSSRGVDVVQVVPIENALADLGDRALVTHHRNTGADVTIKCVGRLRSDESMGVLVERNGRIEVLEYLDLKEETYFYNNTGMLAMNLSFLQKMAAAPLPFHRVQKRKIWKRERFLFDAFVYANKVSALCYPRETCYAPLKSLEQLEEVERRLA